MDINVSFPPEIPLRVGEQSDGVQMSPLALLVIREHINWLTSQAELGIQDDFKYARELNFPSSRKIKILEYGSGESTILLATMFPQAMIYSIEGDKEWYEKVKGWIEEKKLLNVQLDFYEQVSTYNRVVGEKPEVNLRYATCIDQLEPPFDLIINDGAIREMVGDYILSNADIYIGHDGMYLRHDYSMLIERNWLGYHLDPPPDWVNDDERPCYDNFCATHPNYELITVSGNGKWGFRCELGGVWRRV